MGKTGLAEKYRILQSQVFFVGHSRKKLELTGQRYGSLTVLGPAGNIGNRTAWRCRCDCGRELIAKTVHLRSGHVKSCGVQCGLKRKNLQEKNVRRADEKYGGLSGLTYIDGTCLEMLRAKTVRKNNTSGVPGVEWRPYKGTWRASICFKGRRYYLGSYARREDAVRARKLAEERLIEPFLAQFEDPVI